MIPPRFRALAPHAFGWTALAICLGLGWGVSDPRARIPNYSDVLEALWGINLYYTRIIGLGQWPVLDPNIWHPGGLWLGSLGVAPSIFLVALPIRALTGNAALTYNALTLAALIAGWAAAYRLSRELVAPWPAYVAALLYTIVPFHWERVNGHINLNLALAFLPWLMLAALRWARADDRRSAVRAAVWMGLAWGAVITFSLYAIWWGSLIIACAGIATFRRPWWWTLALASVIALAVAAPTLAWFIAGSRAMDQIGDRMPALVDWGASLNSLFIPSIIHPVELVRQFSQSLFHGNGNEAGASNWGIILPLCSAAGWVILRRGAPSARLTARILGLAALAGAILALGAAVKWQGDPILTDGLRPLNLGLWSIGRVLKPGLFDSVLPPAGLDRMIPLPGYLLLLTAPFWEGARVVTRFMFVGGLGLILLAAVLIQRLPRAAGLALAALLVIEALPARTQDLQAPTRAHAAYEWAAAQDNDGSWNILDISDEPKIVVPIVGGGVAYGQALHGIPIASGLSSYLPRSLQQLSLRLADAPGWTRDPGVAKAMTDQRTRFIFVHVLFHWDTRVWDGLRASPLYADRGCFDGARDQVFSEQICVAEVKPAP